jgi:DNA-directed RNA polymerase subunit N (RpoN/RPB10)
MYYTVQTLLKQGKNISQISKELGIDRKTARKMRLPLKIVYSINIILTQVKF